MSPPETEQRTPVLPPARDGVEYPGAVVARLVLDLADPCTFPGGFAEMETTGRIRNAR